jgi:hypothetical protein
LRDAVKSCASTTAVRIYQIDQLQARDAPLGSAPAPPGTIGRLYL